jgi:7-cyano-7-deazaguanine synthase
MARGELRASRELAKSGGVTEHRIARLPQVRELSDIDRKDRFKGYPGSYIPMKNAIYYSLAAAYAEECGASYIMGGHNRDDMKLFVDTSPQFFWNMQQTLWSGSSLLKKTRTTILRPLQHLRKPEVIVMAKRLGVPFELTWSCFLEGRTHCWKCEGCRNRLESFKAAGIEDPLGPPGIPKV